MNYFEIIKNVAVCPGINLKEPQAFDTIDPQIKKIKNAVNQALKSICSCWDWKFRIKKTTFSTVPSLKEYSGVNGEIIKVYYEKSSDSIFELDFMPDIPLMAQTGTPYCYGIEFGKIVLFPVPDRTNNIIAYYLTNNYALSADLLTEKSKLELETDIPIIPDKFQDLIIYKAVLNFFAKPEKKEYSYYLAQYCERLVQAKTEDRGAQDNAPSIEISGRSQFLKRFSRQ